MDSVLTSPARCCGAFPQGFFCGAKIASLDIFDMHFVNLNVFINIGTNMLMKKNLHSHVCEIWYRLISMCKSMLSMFLENKNIRLA
jgi:hypothetical protein